MSPRDTAPPNAPAVHFEPEPFSRAANGLWSPAVLGTQSVCFNPRCSKVFTPTRPWSWFCSDQCRRESDAEMRAIGHKAAPALLAWRMGKHDRLRTADGMVDVGDDLRSLSNDARRYLTRLQGDWYTDRQRRILEAREGS